NAIAVWLAPAPALFSFRGGGAHSKRAALNDARFRYDLPGEWREIRRVCANRMAEFCDAEGGGGSLFEADPCDRRTSGCEPDSDEERGLHGLLPGSVLPKWEGAICRVLGRAIFLLHNDGIERKA